MGAQKSNHPLTYASHSIFSVYPTLAMTMMSVYVLLALYILCNVDAHKLVTHIKFRCTVRNGKNTDTKCCPQQHNIGTD